MRCECTLAGYCKRHGVVKSAEWVALCRTRAEYFRVWEEGRGPGQPVDPTKAKEQSEANERQLQFYRDLWDALHTQENPTQAWFASWCSLVPSFGCGCQSWLREYLIENPPRFNDWFAYSVELHNAISRKLNKEQWTIDRAREHYGVTS